MGAAVIGIEPGAVWGLLQTRFPEIAFTLSFGDLEPLELFREDSGYLNGRTSKGFLYGKDTAGEIRSWKESLFLEGIDVLYVYGIGLGYHYLAMKEWLEEKKERMLVFFEEDPGVLQALFTLPAGTRILENSRVHIFLLPQPVSWKGVFDVCVRQWISDRVDFVAIGAYCRGMENKIKKLRLELLRKNSLMSVAITETLHYHKLMENISANLLALPESSHVNLWKDACKGIPAVICGAGVSLTDSIPAIKELETRAVIFAGGSAITALHHFGIRPHMVIALDPNEEEYGRIKSSGCFEVPFVYSSRLHKKVLSSTNVRPGYLHSDTGGAFENWMNEKLEIGGESLGPELGVEALSVTTLAVPLAKYLGCDPIIFCGVDLSYKDLHRYPPGVIPSSKIFLEDLQNEKRSMEKPVRKKNGEGQFVYSLVKWVMEASCLGSYVKKQTGSKFFNASLQGIKIPHVAHLPIAEFSSAYCTSRYDLRGLLHAKAEETMFSTLSAENVKAGFDDLLASLDRCLPLFASMLEEIRIRKEMPFDPLSSPESGKMQLLEMDLLEEEAYPVCLESIFCIYQKILDGCRPCVAPGDEEAERSNALEKKRQLWEECLTVLQACMKVLRKHTEGVCLENP